ncbi:unnamed protein product [Cuscuta europaea]|uniref:Uncharacterized protein n=1 Tax=Cuscuta europaea TaxID=41803 RepID=A0A9P1EG46_CUSEU|nr:unnamed protein product [Cuscuta europaea]
MQIVKDSPTCSRSPTGGSFLRCPLPTRAGRTDFDTFRMAENPFPGPLRDNFRRHPKVGSAALEKDRKKLMALPEGSEDLITIKDAALPDDLHSLDFQRYHLLGKKDEKYPLIDRVYKSASVLGGSNMDVQSFAALKR